MNQGWEQREFAAAQLGDKRLEGRLKLIARRLAEDPQRSVASAMRGASEIHAAYRFFDNNKTTAEKIFAAHQEAIVSRASQHRRVLLVQDTTELDYTSKKQLQGTGPLAEGPRSGLFCHDHLVLSGEGLALGGWGADFNARDPEEIGKAQWRKQRPIEQKESWRWMEGYKKACELARRLGSDTQVVSCADREGDIFEIFDQWANGLESDSGAAHWLVRSCQNRCLESEQEQEQKPLPKIHDLVASQEVGGWISLEVCARVQNKKVKGGSRVKSKRSKRKAQLEVRWTSHKLKPPLRKASKLKPVEVRVVRATEKNPPPDEPPIDWILLTSLPVDSLADALEIIRLYSLRWQIEVFHRVLKTGCQVEELQIKEVKRLKVAVALYMVVAWRVLYLMKLGRLAAHLPCDLFVEPDEWKALGAVCLGPDKTPKTAPSIGWFVRCVGRLGGHPGRKSDGEPGAQTLWRGMTRLRDFTLAWRVIMQGEAAFDFESVDLA